MLSKQLVCKIKFYHYITCFIVLCWGCSPTENTYIPAHNKALELQKDVDLSQAIVYYKKALTSYRQQKQWELYVLCKNQLIECYINDADYDEALKMAKENVQLFEEALPVKISDEAKSRTFLLIGEALRAKNYYSEAVENLQKSLGFLRANEVNNQLKIAEIYNLIGKIYQSSNEKYLALEYHQKAIDLLNKIPKKTSEVKIQMADTYNFFGWAYGILSKPQVAIGYYRKTLAIRQEVLGKAHAKVSAPFNNIGLNYTLTEKYDSSLYYLKEAIRIQENAMGKDHFDVAGYYNNLGNLFLAQKKYNQSLQSFRHSLVLRTKKFGAQHPKVIQVYNFKGNVFLAQKNYAEALKNYAEAFKRNIKRGEDTNTQISLEDCRDIKQLLLTLEYQAKAYFVKYQSTQQIEDLKKSLSSYEVVIDLLNQHVNTVEKNKDKIFFNARVSKVTADALHVAYLLLQEPASEGQKYLQKAFFFAERNKASVLSSSLAEVNARRFSGIPTKLLRQEKRLRADINFYQNKSLQGSPGKKQLYRDKLFELRQDYRAFIDHLEDKYPNYHALKYQRNLATITQVQQRLKPGQALLQYITGEAQSYVLMITQNSTKIAPLPPSSTLSLVVQKYYYALQGGGNLERFSKASIEAYQALIKPIERDLGGIQKLTIIPDWQLAKLPFGALIDQMPSQPSVEFGDLPYLIQRFEINYHYSATIWYKKSPQSKQAAIDFLAFAPYSEGKGKVLNTRYKGGVLPASKIEVNTIFKMFREKQGVAEAYLAGKATKATFLKKGPDAQIIHIASHSEYDERNENLTRIYFAKDNKVSMATEKQENRLLLGSIYNLDLKANLVVLSSCESGLGKSYKGEGMMSLSRSFLYAGAKNIVFSYWEVNDEYTKDLMISFYKGMLNQKYTYTQALQIAKKDFIQKHKKFSPKYWSSFAIVGD
ncbi:MAG TPA: hypothetical protein DCS93_24650 [Microscillaceae bacterium]|nr:hypothetical protein [Microscillaceae bacterium]